MDDLPQKYCPKCEHFKPATLTYFHSAKGRPPDNLCGWCKECRYKHNKVPSERNRITQRKYDRGHRATDASYRAAKRANCTHRRARIGAVMGNFTAQDIQKQYTRQKGKCYYCRKKVGKSYHVDHIIPLSRGGSNGPDNLVVACQHCNLSKGARLPHEWKEGGKLL